MASVTQHMDKGVAWRVTAYQSSTSGAADVFIDLSADGITVSLVGLNAAAFDALEAAIVEARQKLAALSAEIAAADQTVREDAS